MHGDYGRRKGTRSLADDNTRLYAIKFYFGANARRIAIEHSRAAAEMRNAAIFPEYFDNCRCMGMNCRHISQCRGDTFRSMGLSEFGCVYELIA